MDTSDLIKECHILLKKENLSDNLKDSKKMFYIFRDVITSNIANGKKVEILNLGIFTSVYRLCIDPSDLQKEKVQRWIIKFSSSVSLRRRINGK
jgi:nucleoid DNA-binding protein